MARRTDVNRSHRHKDIERHITGEADLLEQGAVDAPTENVPWEVKQGEVHSDVALESDLGDGKEIILRQFQYMFPPNLTEKPTKEQILTDGYKKFLEAQLWMVDNLELVMEPRVVIEEKGFRIFATCQPRKGNIIGWEDRDNIKTLKQIAHDPAGDTK